MRNLGGFVSSAGGIYMAVARGEELGVNTIMIHPTPPQRWNTSPFEKEEAEKFNQAIKASSVVKKTHIHGIYLVNLANPDKQKFHLSKLSLVNYLELAEWISVEGIIFHTGSFKDTTPQEGFKRITQGIDWIFENTKSSKQLWLEVAAGAGNVVGSKIEDLKRIKESVKNPERIGFCLDTQHLWASGYDIKTNLEAVIEELDKKLGINNIKCIHFNDSKTPLASARDRHENLGEGLIGKEALKSFLNNPKLKTKDFVMETPAMKDLTTAISEVKKLQNWAD